MSFTNRETVQLIRWLTVKAMTEEYVRAEQEKRPAVEVQVYSVRVIRALQGE